MKRRKLQSATVLSQYGLPKHFVVTERWVTMPPRAEPWLQARDDFDGQLYDVLAALEMGAIDRRTFDREKARLSVARRKANDRMDQAVRVSAQSHPRFHPRRLR